MVGIPLVQERLWAASREKVMTNDSHYRERNMLCICNT